MMINLELSERKLSRGVAAKKCSITSMAAVHATRAIEV